MSRIVYGLNPVLELLRAGKAEVAEIVLARGREDRRTAQIRRMAASAGIKLRLQPRAELDKLTGTTGHQGAAALVGSFAYTDPALIIDDPNLELVVLLDGIQDPHNLGAIARTALGAGAQGLFIPKDRAAGVTPAAVKVSAGALEHLPVCRVTNLNRLAEQLKEAGWWLIGTAGEAETALWDLPELPDRLALVIGSEGKGMGRALGEKCDFLASIPLSGGLESLNASTAAAVVLFEVKRRRGGKG